MNPTAYPLSFSIVTPVYNEEAIIINSIQHNIQVLEKTGLEYEIIVVNDGSKDNSYKLILENFKSHPKIKIINLDQNRGFGYAIKMGLSKTINTFLICVPADSPLTGDVFESFKAATARADIVVSARIARLGYTPRMLLNSYIYHWLVKILFGIHLKDFNWIHLYHRKIFDASKIEITSNGIFMLAEVLIRAQMEGYTFCEIYIPQSERLTGIASASRFTVILKTLKEMITFWFNRFDRR